MPECPGLEGGDANQRREGGEKEESVPGPWGVSGHLVSCYVWRGSFFPVYGVYFIRGFCEHSFINNACSGRPISSQFCVNCVPSNLVADSV